MAIYTLTLPAGVIAVKDKIYTGSNTAAVWSPNNPAANGGWVDGDKLVVSCELNLNPKNVTPPPPATDYVGLCAAACISTDTARVKALTAAARAIMYPNPGALFGTEITEAASATAANIFYDAKPTTNTFALTPASRGKLENYVYQWTMTYNGSNTVVSNGKTVEIVFGYGDPMDSETVS